MRGGFLITLMIIVGAFVCSVTVANSYCVHAQDLETLEAPPLMKYIPQAERAQLASARDTKGRTRLSLQLTEEHLENAERLTRSQQFSGAATELGIYHALVEDALLALRALGGTKNKDRDLFKLMEITLRAHASRLEAMRRATPFEEALGVKTTYEHVREARTTVLNAFFGEEVMTEEASPRKKNVRAEAINESFSRLDSAFALLTDKSKAPDAIPILIELLKDADSFVRLDAAYALGFIGPQAREAVPHLIALLKDQEATVRNNAAYALGLIGSDADRVVPELVKLIRDRDARVRFNAAEAIGRFGRAAVPALNRVTQEQQK
jgi:HEAT repeat protein